MPKRGNNIYKRKDGRWEGRYIVGRRADGSAIYHSLYDHTYAGIKEKLTQACQEQKKQTSVPSFGDVRLSAVAFDWLAAKSSHLKPGSIARYETIIRCHILPLLGDTAIKDLTAEKLSAAVWQLKKKQLAVKTLTDISVVLKAILKSAAAEHFLPVGVYSTLDISLPRQRRPQIETFTDREVRRLTAYLLKDTDLNKLAVLLALNSGLRLGELCALCWQDIDWPTATLRVCRSVQRSKGGLILQTPKSASSHRTIPLTQEMLALLHEQQHDGEYIFGGVKPLEPRYLQRHFTDLQNDAGIEPRNFHLLRHTFATRFISGGGSAKSLAEILGHANVQTTLQLYVHPTLEQKRSDIAAASTLTGLTHIA